MSVKVVDRNESKVQYVTTAVELQKKTMFVLTRMSNKMQVFLRRLNGACIINYKNYALAKTLSLNV